MGFGVRPRFRSHLYCLLMSMTLRQLYIIYLFFFFGLGSESTES